MKIGLAITGSFCTLEKIIEVIKEMKKSGHEVIPIVSDCVINTDTRFGSAKDFMKKLTKLTGNEAVDSIVKAERLGPNNMIDILVIAPCTGNTIAKIANSITDNAVTMATKAHMRNNKPVIIAISTNDALGLNMTNIAKLLNTKGIFFVPFGQDAPTKKPKSLIANYDLILPTIDEAIKGNQIQPLVLSYQN